VTSVPRLRSVATVVAVVGLVCVVALGVMGAVLRTSPEAPGDAGASLPSSVVTAGKWRRVVGPDGGSYAVPPGWRSRPLDEHVAYRDEGQVAVEGLALSQSWANDCRSDFAPVPVAWALLGAPVRSTNPEGVARAAAAGWVRGYAATESGSKVPSPVVRAIRLGSGEPAVTASVTVDLKDSANPCAGDTAELTVVGLRDGDEVRSLVVARYLGVRGAPTDAAYSGVLGSLRTV
jgi:hypothetical protein